jgi:hypothetical protein
MKHKGQISFEALVGISVFLIFFLGISAFYSNQNNYYNSEAQKLSEKNSCYTLSQALFEAKNSETKWSGTLDKNFYLNGDTIYVNYVVGQSFNGTYCTTIDTNLTKNILQGDVNVSYETANGFVIIQ